MIKVAPNIPQECRTAINFTEVWRKDDKGQRLNRDNASCDTHTLAVKRNPWFRFTGDAGTHLLTFCPATNGNSIRHRI